MSEKEFCLFEMVNLFANDVWLFGVISGNFGKEYYVYFPAVADNFAYPPNVLRVHPE